MTRFIFFKYTRSMETTQAVKKMPGHSRLKNKQVNLIKKHSRPIIKKRFVDLLWALLFLILLIFFMFYVSPNSIINFLLPNSYLPFFFLLFLTSFFFLKFILNNERLAFCIVFNFLIILFFHVQNLHFNYFLMIILSLTTLGLLIINQIEKRLL